MKNIFRNLVVALSCLLGAPALAQNQTFSSYVTGLAPAASVIGTERMFALQSGIPKTMTPYQILSNMAGDCTMASPPAIVCTKINGLTLASPGSATTDTTNAANISSGSLPLARLALLNTRIYVGNVSNIPVAVALSNDCTIANTGAITCLKTNNVSFVASATTDTTNATNISTGTLANGRVAATNLSAGNVNGGVVNALPVANGGTNCAVASGTCLDNISSLATTGYVKRTGAGTYSTVSTVPAATDISGTLPGANMTAVNLAASGNGGVTGALPYANMPTGSLNTVLGFWGSTTQSALSIPNCAGALQYNTTTHVFGCGAGGGNVSNSGTPVSGQIAQWTSATVVQGASISSLSLVAVVRTQVFNSSGTYTPSTGLQYSIIECVGGGGAGGGSFGQATPQLYVTTGGGGGGGGYARAVSSAATIGASQTVSIGNGGSGSAGATGGNGNATSVGTLCNAGGGVGGTVGNISNVGVGGAGGAGVTGNSILASGNSGGAGGWFIQCASCGTLISTVSGNGGNSIWGGGGGGVAVGAGSAASGSNGLSYGGGGAGSQSNSVAANGTGGSGASGYVIITEFANQ